jgi:ABC-2 type transport system ATP-binding protein
VTAAGALIEAEGVEVRYHGGPEPAVKGVSLTLAPGEGLFVGGQPGAGKTSLLRGLLGLVPCLGRLRLLGAAPGSPRLRGRVGYGPQGRRFADGLRIDEAVAGILALHGDPRPRRAAAEAIERTGLGLVSRRPAAGLDAEGARRLSLALAIAGDPDLVVLDDPWALRDTFAEIARARARGAGVLVASSEPGGIAPALGRRITLADGAVL